MKDNEVEIKFHNFYTCASCGTDWEDFWDSACNDHCPECDAEIEPYLSEKVAPEPISPMPQEIEQAIVTIFSWVNKYGYEKEVSQVILDEISNQHRTLQQNFMRVVLVPIINLFAEKYEKKYYDARNENTCKVCSELSKVLKDKYFPFI